MLVGDDAEVGSLFCGRGRKNLRAERTRAVLGCPKCSSAVDQAIDLGLNIPHRREPL